MPAGFGGGRICGFIPSQMTDLPESQTSMDHYEAALEASCDALITLRVIRASATSSCPEVEDVEGHITRAINSQQRAIVELRLAKAEPGNPPVIGFVLGADVGRQSR